MVNGKVQLPNEIKIHVFFCILSLARGHRENLSNREKSNLRPSDLFAFMLYHGARLLPSNSFALRGVLCSSVVEHRSTALRRFWVYFLMGIQIYSLIHDCMSIRRKTKQNNECLF